MPLYQKVFVTMAVAAAAIGGAAASASAAASRSDSGMTTQDNHLPSQPVDNSGTVPLDVHSP